MTQPRYWTAPQEEGYYILFTPYYKDFDYDAVLVRSESTPPDDMVCIGNDGSSWPATAHEHTWYYGPIDEPPEVE
jgi:hypothetical protein